GEAAVAPLGQLDLEFQDEVAVFLLAHQPRAAIFAGAQDAILDRPFASRSGLLPQIVPGPDEPSLRRAVVREQRSKALLPQSRRDDQGEASDSKRRDISTHRRSPFKGGYKAEQGQG